ncbi:4724_t:CDS:2, partial [Acaulospora morrowiae]
MASAVFVLDLKGKVLISRNYRGDIPMSAVEKFMPLVLEAEEEQQAPTPCFTHEGVNYLSDRDPSRVSCSAQLSIAQNLNSVVLALTKKNSNATMILLFLHKLTEVFTEYFKELEEESI